MPVSWGGCWQRTDQAAGALQGGACPGLSALQSSVRMQEDPARISITAAQVVGSQSYPEGLLSLFNPANIFSTTEGFYSACSLGEAHAARSQQGAWPLGTAQHRSGGC